MGDVFKEQIIKRNPTFKDTLKRVGIIIGAFFLSILSFMFLGPFAVFVAFAVCFAAYFAMSFFNVEYEYVFTNGDLDIDIIYSKSRRKRLFSSHVNHFDIMCHVEDKTRIGEFQSAQETKDYSSGTVTENTYAFLTNHNGKRVKFIIEPNKKMLKAIGTVLTRRKLFIKQ